MKTRTHVVVSMLVAAWALLPSSPVSAAEWEKLAADQLPPPVLATMKRELGNQLAKEPRLKKRITREGTFEYRVSGETSTGEVDLELTSTGALTRKKEVLTPDATPKDILAVSKREFGVLPVNEIARVTKAGEVTYEVDAEAADRRVDLVFTAEGGLKRKVEEWKDPRPSPTVTAPPAKVPAPAAPKAAPKKKP